MLHKSLVNINKEGLGKCITQYTSIISVFSLYGHIRKGQSFSKIENLLHHRATPFSGRHSDSGHLTDVL